MLIKIHAMKIKEPFEYSFRSPQEDVPARSSLFSRKQQPFFIQVLQGRPAFPDTPEFRPFLGGFIHQRNNGIPV
jgi:hypothetical protein